MIHLKDSEKSYWHRYLDTIEESKRPERPFITSSFAGNKDCTDELLGLYLSGKKTAGSSLAEDFLAAGDPLPKVGNFWILLNSRNQPSCILRTINVLTYKFKDVPEQIALLEAEGDLSLEYWRKSHTELYSPFLKSWGINDIEDSTVITEIFEIVYR